MSVGHRTENWLWSEEILKEVEKKLHAEVKLDTKHDVPYTAGYSKDGKTVYIDRTVPQFLEVKAKGSRAKLVKIDIWNTFLFHETTELSLESEPYDLEYVFAHQCALHLERDYVEALGADWTDYNTKTLKIVNAIYARKIFPNIPKDLDKEPMYAEDDEAILEQMH